MAGFWRKFLEGRFTWWAKSSLQQPCPEICFQGRGSSLPVVSGHIKKRSDGFTRVTRTHRKERFAMTSDVLERMQRSCQVSCGCLLMKLFNCSSCRLFWGNPWCSRSSQFVCPAWEDLLICRVGVGGGWGGVWACEGSVTCQISARSKSDMFWHVLNIKLVQVHEAHVTLDIWMYRRLRIELSKSARLSARASDFELFVRPLQVCVSVGHFHCFRSSLTPSSYPSLLLHVIYTVY